MLTLPSHAVVADLHCEECEQPALMTVYGVCNRCLGVPDEAFRKGEPVLFNSGDCRPNMTESDLERK